jgi:tRNA(fMet)-specific endonuclease VapC
MKLMLDTSAYSAFNRGDKRLMRFFRADNDILVPLIVVGELRTSFSLGSKRQENETLLQKLLDSPNVNTLTLTDKTATLFAAVYYQLKCNGAPMGTNDMWIAALALEHDCMLVTLDSDFERVPDLSVAPL